MRKVRRPEESIFLPTGTFLMIRDLLNRAFEAEILRPERAKGAYELALTIDEAEHRALHFLVGAIERSVHDSMTDGVPDLIAEEKRWIMSLPK